jgi:P2 family phage contractile tail tube protein
MAARDVKKNINLFVDGQGFAGQIEDFTPPVLENTGEKFRGGGMLGSTHINMGMEELTAEFSLIAFDKMILSKFGVRQGMEVPLVAREALESHDGTITAVVHTMRGVILKMDQGTSKAGDKVALKVSMSLNYYKLEHGGAVVQEHDVVNMIHISDGVDAMAETRAALGM